MSCLHIPYNNIFAEITIVVSPLGDKEKEEVKCILDTGAFMTTVPREVINKLGIHPTGAVGVRAWNGSVKTNQPTYPLKIFLCGREFELEVLTTENSKGLIGMDILNEWLFELNGPGREFSLS